jgi:hypothetical protein
MNDDVDLVLELCAEPKGTVGYGVVYEGKVRRVLRGNLDTDTILLTILSSDHANTELFHEHKTPAVIEAGFSKHRTNEPYAMMPITGFVDPKRTSWKLVYAR